MKCEVGAQEVQIKEWVKFFAKGSLTWESVVDPLSHTSETKQTLSSLPPLDSRDTVLPNWKRRSHGRIVITLAATVWWNNLRKSDKAL